MNVVYDHNSKVIIIHVPEGVDELLVHPLGLQHLEHPGEYHEVKSCHIVIVKDSCTLIPAVSHEDGIPGFVNAMVNPPIITCHK